MTVLEYSIKLGELLRTTNEGAELIALKNELDDNYSKDSNFKHFDDYAESKSSQLYFYSWDLAYKTYCDVLKDDKLEHRELFLPTAQFVCQNNSIIEFSKAAVSFGNLFEKIVSTIISIGKYDNIIPSSWKYKIRNAISDIQIAYSRTLLPKIIIAFHQKNHGKLNTIATQKYLTKREEIKTLPFSNDAMKFIKEDKELCDEEKIIYEKMLLMVEVVKKGIFYGFWGIINEIPEDDLVSYNELNNTQLQEISFVHKNNFSSFLGKGWLYKIQLIDKSIYFLAHTKTVHFGENKENTTVLGIVYPSTDVGLFS